MQTIKAKMDPQSASSSWCAHLIQGVRKVHFCVYVGSHNLVWFYPIVNECGSMADEAWPMEPHVWCTLQYINMYVVYLASKFYLVTIAY